MKCFTKIATVVLFAALCSAEPPLPGNQYLPPAEPSNEYLPPVQSYQAPANNYLPPQQNGRRQPPAAKPSNQYLAPDVTSAIFPNQGGNNGYPASRNGNGNGLGNGNGNGNGHRQNDEDSWGPAKYEFKYDVQDDESGNNFGHMEQRDGDLTTGRYYVLLPDGRTQIVEYEADGNGYRPTITYEGVANNNGNGNNGFNGGNNGNNGFNNGAAGRGAGGDFAGYN
ncbi:hypothetical protein ACFFRR_008929 [Megaselia abdita]